ARSDFSERGFKNQQHRYELAPAQPFPAARHVKLQIASTLAGKQGPLTLASEVELPFITYGPPKVMRLRFCSEHAHRCPYGPLLIQTSNPMDAKSAKGKVTIEPAVEIDWERVESGAP